MFDLITIHVFFILYSDAEWFFESVRGIWLHSLYFFSRCLKFREVKSQENSENCSDVLIY